MVYDLCSASDDEGSFEMNRREVEGEVREKCYVRR